MRRKVIQDFANVFCQHFIQLPSGYDLAAFVFLGSGRYELNILTGECNRQGLPIPKLQTCDDFKDWLLVQLDKHRIPPEGIKNAILKIDVTVSQLQVRESFGNEFASALFSFVCASEITTDEVSYYSNLSDQKAWAFDWYYNRLYGSVMKLG